MSQESYHYHAYQGCIPPILEGLDVLGGQITNHFAVLATADMYGPKSPQEIHDEMRRMMPQVGGNMLPRPRKIAQKMEDLADIGAVTAEWDGRRSLYRLNEYGYEYALPLSATLLGWQADHRSHFMQQLWDVKLSQHLGGRQNFGMLQTIADHTRGVGMGGLRTALYNKDFPLREVRRQQSLGILDVKESFNDQTYVLFRPPKQEDRFDFGDDHASWFFTEAADLLYSENGGHRMRMSEKWFIEETTRHNPGLTQKEIQSYLHFAMRGGSVPFIEHAEPKLRIRLTANWQRPVRQLINRVVGLSEPENREAARRRADIIKGSQKEIRMLMRRSQVVTEL